MPNPVLQTIDSETPTDVQHPRMYEHAVYILGGVALLCVLSIAILFGLGRPVDAGLIAIGASATGYIGGMLTPRAKV